MSTASSAAPSRCFSPTEEMCAEWPGARRPSVCSVLARHAVSIDNPLDDDDAHLRNLKEVTSEGFRKDELVYSSPLGLRATVLGESTGLLQVMLHPHTRHCSLLT
jgi:hypothetical protein